MDSGSESSVGLPVSQCREEEEEEEQEEEQEEEEALINRRSLRHTHPTKSYCSSYTVPV